MKKKRSDRVEFLQPADQIRSALVDLSETGAAVHLSSQVPKGSSIRIRINDLELDAMAVYNQERVGGYKVGLQFQDVGENQRARISDLVEKFSRGVPLEFHSGAVS